MTLAVGGTLNTNTTIDGEERAGYFSWCVFLVMVVWLFLAVPWVCLRFVIVVSPDHTHLLFLFTLDNTLGL